MVLFSGVKNKKSVPNGQVKTLFSTTKLLEQARIKAYR